MMQTYFGSPDHPLFGVYHQPRGRASSPTRAVLICPPIGQEFMRSHMALRLLAKQIARRGSHVLRFDYRGVGDSHGNLEDVHSLETWEQDIVRSIEYLKETSGAHQVMLLGLRIGAGLAHRVARQSADVHSLLLWEPVTCGSHYVQSQRAMHREMLDLWVCKMKTENSDSAEELLGSIYSRSLVEELEDLRVDLSQTSQPHAVVTVSDSELSVGHDEPSLQKIIPVDDVDSWSELPDLETAWLRSTTTRTIVQTADDMFDRLQKFGALSPVIPHVAFPIATPSGVVH
ncbi:MAG: alpha/beta fold hydrolase [Rubripirellula sp.]